jgi:hypothetical protein
MKLSGCILWFAVFGLNALPVCGQQTVVKGKITDAATGDVLPFVNVSFKGSKIGTTTDINGRYQIATYYATDSLIVSFVGYQQMAKRVRKDREQVIDFALEAGSVQLREIVVKPDKKYRDPAYAIMEKVVVYKPINNHAKLDAYEYEVYNKIEFDLNNIDENFKNQRAFRPFQFVFDFVDSSDKKPYLPVFMTESLSDLYYTRNPKRKKEIIKATNVSGVKNEGVQQFLGDMYQNINMYDNYITIFNKSFVSPAANLGEVSYHYYLLDSMEIDQHKCYKIKFVPRREHELNFTGLIWITDTTYAIKQVEAVLSTSANVNYVQHLEVYQEYVQVEREVWMLGRDKLVVDFNLTDRTIGIYGRKTSTYRDFAINKPRSDDFYGEGSDVVVLEDADKYSRNYWDSARHIGLSKSEENIYKMVDTLHTIPLFKTYIDIIKTITVGYKEFERIELGPYFNIYSFNPIEGSRFRLGIRTLKGFSEKIRLRTFGAYGTRDQMFKYGFGTDFFISRKPWSMIHLDYWRDIEQMGASFEGIQQNILASVARTRGGARMLNYGELYRLGLEHWWSDGFSNKLEFIHKNIWSASSNLGFEIPAQDGTLRNAGYVKFSEVKLSTRWGRKEKFLYGAFDRYSVGTKSPVFGAVAILGLKGTLGSQYNYQKAMVFMQDKIFLNPFGYSMVLLMAGKVWGTVPFPVLELHNGNETYLYDDNAFNLMNFLEYASDQYVSGSVTHHFNGLFFNHIPLFRKLKFREVISLRGVAGNLDPAHTTLMTFPNTLGALPKPYFESSIGIENILNLIRIDAIYRLTNLDRTAAGINNIRNFGIGLSLNFTF